MTQTAAKAIIKPFIRVAGKIAVGVGAGAYKKENESDKLEADILEYFTEADTFMLHIENLFESGRIHPELYRSACRLHAKRVEHEAEWNIYQSKLCASDSVGSTQALAHNLKRGLIFTKEVACDMVEELTGFEIDEDFDKVVMKYGKLWARLVLLANSLAMHEPPMTATESLILLQRTIQLSIKLSGETPADAPSIKLCKVSKNHSIQLNWKHCKPTKFHPKPGPYQVEIIKIKKVLKRTVDKTSIGYVEVHHQGNLSDEISYTINGLDSGKYIARVRVRIFQSLNLPSIYDKTTFGKKNQQEMDSYHIVDKNQQELDDVDNYCVERKNKSNCENKEPIVNPHSTMATNLLPLTNLEKSTELWSGWSKASESVIIPSNTHLLNTINMKKENTPLVNSKTQEFHTSPVVTSHKKADEFGVSKGYTIYNYEKTNKGDEDQKEIVRKLALASGITNEVFEEQWSTRGKS